MNIQSERPSDWVWLPSQETLGPQGGNHDTQIQTCTQWSGRVLAMLLYSPSLLNINSVEQKKWRWKKTDCRLPAVDPRQRCIATRRSDQLPGDLSASKGLHPQTAGQWTHQDSGTLKEQRNMWIWMHVCQEVLLLRQVVSKVRLGVICGTWTDFVWPPAAVKEPYKFVLVQCRWLVKMETFHFQSG